MKYLVFFYCSLLIACNATTTNEKATSDSATDYKTSKPLPTGHKAILFVDSALVENSDQLRKNQALRNQYLTTLQAKMLPLIAKGGFYNDTPFELYTTVTQDGKAYGNFIYDDEKYTIKVTCMIPDKELKLLEENKTYFIRFKNAKYQEGFTTYETLAKIEFPVVYATLVSSSMVKPD